MSAVLSINLELIEIDSWYTILRMRFEKEKKEKKDIDKLTNNFQNISIPSTHCYLRSDT